MINIIYLITRQIDYLSLTILMMIIRFYGINYELKSFFDQQSGAAPATSPTAAGAYIFSSVVSSWLASPAGTPPIFLPGIDPQPVFDGSGTLTNYMNGNPSPSMHTNHLLISNGFRPWSAGTEVDFNLRHLAYNGMKVDIANPVQIPKNGNFTLNTVDPGFNWFWEDADLKNFTSGSISVIGIYGPDATFTSTNVSGSGYLAFDLGPSPISPDHPKISIQLDAEEAMAVPVELISFKAALHDDKVILSWSTDHEINNERFQLWNSPNGNDWSLINEIQGRGTSHAVHYYSYTDHSPFPGKCFYQLKQIDYNGNITDAGMLMVEIPGTQISKTIWHAGEIIQFSNSGEIRIYNPSGKLIKSTKGFELTIPPIIPGVYIIMHEGQKFKIWVSN